MGNKGFASKPVGFETPRFARTQTFLQLQAHWYAELRKRGFRDIETGRDTNNEKAYDPRNGARVSRILHFMPDGAGDVDVEAMMEANARAFGGHTSFAATPTAIAWRNISHAAHDLAEDYPHRVFLIDLAQVGCIARYLLARHRLSWKLANAAFHCFLEDVGMEAYRGLLVSGPTGDGAFVADDVASESALARAARLLFEQRAISETDYHRYMWSRGMEAA